MNALDNLIGCTLIVGSSSNETLSSAVLDAASGKERVVLLTDDAEKIGDLGAGVTTIEPEDLFAEGVASIDDSFDVGAKVWLDAMFPGRLDGRSLGEIMWTDVLLRPAFTFRAQYVVMAKRIFDEMRPSRVWFVGRPPYYCEPLPEEARRRGIAMREEARQRLARSAKRAARWPIGLTLALRNTVVESARIVLRARWRTAARRPLDELGRGLGATAERPRLWIAVDPAWVHPMRFLLHSLFEPLERANVPYGLLFAPSFGVPQTETPEGRRSNEVALFDGTLAGLRPDAIAQISGPEDARSLASVFAEWLRHVVPACAGVIRHCDHLCVDGVAASTIDELPELVQRATRDLLLVLETRAATRRWLHDYPGAREVVFNLAAMSQNTVADHMMQKAGIATVDFMHGYAAEGNLLRLMFRSVSTYSVAWTTEQAERVAVRGSNRTSVGGYLPWKSLPSAARGDKPRILVLSNYVTGGHFHQYAKYAKRLAAAVRRLVEIHGSRCEIRVRLHPYDDRDAWNARFEDVPPPAMSTSKRVAEDLAWADIVIATPSSTVVEALAYRMPIIFHRAVVPEPYTLFGHVADRRWFRSGEELATQIAALFDAADPEPERRLLHACFGASGSPKNIIDLLAEIDPELFGRARRPVDVQP